MAVEADKSARIVDAMRASVARRGVAGSTFDHVAREAGVSRGLLHYYFATKENLLVEVVRRDCDLRMTVLDEQLAAEFAELMRRTREHVAAVLARKQAEGVLQLSADPEAVAEVLFALADGVALRMLAEPERD